MKKALIAIVLGMCATAAGHDVTRMAVDFQEGRGQVDYGNGETAEFGLIADDEEVVATLVKVDAERGEVDAKAVAKETPTASIRVEPELERTTPRRCKKPSSHRGNPVALMEALDWVTPYSCKEVKTLPNGRLTNIVDVEHIVAWSEAVDSGLDCARAKEFYQDGFNHTGADSRINRHQKSDKDPAEWMPEHNQCWFAQRVVDVKEKYALSMDAAEKTEVDRVLVGCTAAEKATVSCD